MKLAIVTTLGVNAGDHFIYEGFKRLFPRDWLGSTFLIDKTQIPRSKDYRQWVDASDLVVICGSPILYHACYKMRWQRELLRYCERREKPILLCAVGSNFPCDKDGRCQVPQAGPNSPYAAFLRRYYALAWRPISVRDAYARRFLEDLGIPHVTQLACPSLFAQPVRQESDGDWIAFIWGETYWQAPLSPKRVFRKLRRLQRRLARRFRDKRIVWFCHDLESYERLCRRVGSEEVIYCANPTDYFLHYARCAFGVSVKVHGTMLLASMGIPSVLLQLDSRAATLHAFGESGVPLATSLRELTRLCVQKWESRGAFREQIQKAKARARESYAAYFGETPDAVKNRNTPP